MKRVALVLGITAAMGVVPSVASAGNGTQAVESQVVESQLVRSQLVRSQLVRSQLVSRQIVSRQIVESALVRSAALSRHQARAAGRAQLRTLAR
jgi:PIN domain nuclease of toxin-antitoxin system